MEENNNEDVIYDLETEGAAPQADVDSSNDNVDINSDENEENPENDEDNETNRNTDGTDTGDSAENTENADPARVEIERMVEELGAETLLGIIRDNRNAAIRQIIREVEASRYEALPSGASVSRSCSSIFDLAAMA